MRSRRPWTARASSPPGIAEHLALELVIVDDAEAAAHAAAEELARAAQAGSHIALAGGSTPRLAYELAASLEPDWSRTEVWWGDERCVPPDDARSNYRLVQESLLDRLARPPAGVHRIRGELDAVAAAEAYDAELGRVTLDLALLGLGTDGHTASLFPNAATLEERDRRAVAAEPALEPFVPRVTMTLPMLSAAALVLFLVAGEEKASAAARAFAGPASRGTPASLVRSSHGRTVALLDRGAAHEVVA
jgi:6-phosphogluconolactonase